MIAVIQPSKPKPGVPGARHRATSPSSGEAAIRSCHRLPSKRNPRNQKHKISKPPTGGFSYWRKTLTKEEVIAAIKECANRLGNVPSLAKVTKMTDIDRHDIEKLFGKYSYALEACGMERRGSGYRVSMRKLFLEWAELVRKLGRVPNSTEWELHSKSCATTLRKRYGNWHRIAPGMLDYARREKLDSEWKDVQEIVVRHLQPAGARENSGRANMNSVPRVFTGRRMYGPPLMLSPLIFEPTNESGVLFVFGTVAHQLGFAVTHIQTEFPDGEAMREVAPRRWQRVRIEFEYESRNFLAHMHPTTGCDLIVCWHHNWPECPLEVVELQKVLMAK